MCFSVSAFVKKLESALFFSFQLFTRLQILDWSKLKAIIGDKSSTVQIMKVGFRSEENFVGIGENAGYQHFLLFPQCFQRLSFFIVVKIKIVW